METRAIPSCRSLVVMIAFLMAAVPVGTLFIALMTLAGLLSWRIDVFDTKQPKAIIGACLQVAGSGCNQRSEM